MKNTHQTRNARFIPINNVEKHCNGDEINAPLDLNEAVELPVHVEFTPDYCGNENQQPVLGNNVPGGQNSTGDVVEEKFDDYASIAPEDYLEGKADANPLAVLNPSLGEVSAFSPGLTIVNISDAALLPSVRTVIGAGKKCCAWYSNAEKC